METKDNTEDVNIQKYFLIVKRHWRVSTGVFATFVALSGAALLLDKPAYEASGKLLFQINRTSSYTGVGEKQGQLESLKREANPLDTQGVLIQSAPIIQEVIRTLNLKDKHGVPLTPEVVKIKTEPVLNTDVLKVSFTSSNPEMAKAVVDQVMTSFVASNIQSNRAEASAAGTFIQNQLPWAEKELNRRSEALRKFKAENQIIDLHEETQGAVKTVASLEDELNHARSQFSELTAQETDLRKQLNFRDNRAVDLTSLSQVPGLQELISEHQKVETQLANKQNILTEENPTIVQLKKQKAGLRALIQERTNESLGYKANVAPGNLEMGKIKQDITADLVKLQSQRLGTERKIQTLSNLREVYSKRAGILPNLEKKQGELERSLSVAQKSYENLLTKQQETKIAENQNIGNARVLEPARVYSSPTAMKMKIGIGVGGIFGGLLIGIAAGFLVDIIDRRLKTAKEAEELFGQTLLGLIPNFETENTSTAKGSMLSGISNRVIVATSPCSVIHEAYHMLRANMKFISLDKKVRTIVVTSSVSGEGKSEVSANLATVLAQAGRRVLLVDADMRRPHQHHLWGLINSVGLSNVMVDEEKLSVAVQKVTPQLSVLTAGVMPPNPLAIIDSERMTTLVETLSDQYDYVVFDTPPLVGTADAAVLGKMVDGVLVVARPGVVDSSSVAAAKSLLSRSEANVLGIVANGVNIKHEPGGFFYYPSNRTDTSDDKVKVKVKETEVGT